MIDALEAYVALAPPEGLRGPAEKAEAAPVRLGESPVPDLGTEQPATAEDPAADVAPRPEAVPPSGPEPSGPGGQAA
jgi:hypothetical protein